MRRATALSLTTGGPVPRFVTRSITNQFMEDTGLRGQVGWSGREAPVYTEPNTGAALTKITWLAHSLQAHT